MNFFCYKSICVMLFFVLCASAGAQNLIPNPSFETYDKEALEKYDIHYFKKKQHSWITYGTVDFYHKDLNALEEAHGTWPQNGFGCASPKDGRGYIGFWAFNATIREAIQSPLKSPLQAGQLYCVKFHVNRGEGSCLEPNFQVYFNEEKLYVDRVKVGRIDFDRMEKEPKRFAQLQDEQADGENWNVFGGVYKAQGGESFMTIANFHSREYMQINRGIKRKKISPKGKEIELFAFPRYYYFIDAVSLVAIESEGECDCMQDKTAKEFTTKEEGCGTISIDAYCSRDIELGRTPVKALEKNQAYTLKRIFFEFDQAVLTSDSKKELDLLVEQLKQHPQLQVQLIGHTDEVGTMKYNQQLSEKRAKAAAAYVLGKGVGKEQIVALGKGSEEPLDRKNGAENAANRRVEIVVNKIK